MNYKNIKSGVVISSDEYYRIPNKLKNAFVGTYDSVTHRAPDNNYSNSFDWLETAIEISLIESAVGSFDSPSYDTTVDDSPSSPDVDFGGGDFGGGGAGDSW